MKNRKNMTAKSLIGGLFKTIAVILSLCCIFSVLLAVYFLSWDEGTENNLNIYYSKLSRECVAGTYDWDGNEDTMTIVVPDEYEGVKLKSLGGATGTSAPTCFGVIVPDSMYGKIESSTNSTDCIGNIENAVTYTFTVKLGKNVKNLENLGYKEYLMDADSNVIYIIELYFECSSENKWIYSEDGKLYDKKTGEFIELDC